MKKLGLAVALTLGLGSVVAGAAPVSGATANTPAAQDQDMAGGHEQGPHRHGHMRAQLEKLHADLHLSAQQERAWQRIRTHQRSLREEMRAHRHQVAQVMHEELAKAHPDLARVAAAQDRGQARLQAGRKAMRAEMLAFYAHLSPPQQTVVRDFLRQRMERMQHRHHEHQDRESSGQAQQ